MSAEQFFYEHAGWSYDPTKESPEQGRRRSAREYAEAERWAKASGLTFEWVDDWTTENHVKEYDGYDEEPATCETCIARDESGRVVASLSCIDDASDDYRRVIEAELADEVFAELRV